MIRNESEYQSAKKRLDKDRDFALQQKAELEAKGYTPEQVERGMEPLMCFIAQLAEEVTAYKSGMI